MLVYCVVLAAYVGLRYMQLRSFVRPLLPYIYIENNVVKFLLFVVFSA